MFTLLNSLKVVLYGLFNVPYITPEIESMTGPLAVHVSDTPGFCYPYIYRLIERIEPKVLIHTGDMLDEIKLEIRPAELEVYSRRIGNVIGHLESFSIDKIFLVPGNHDDTQVILEHSRRSIVLPEKSWIELEGYTFFLSHKYYDLPVDADFYLFGHSLPEMGKVRAGTRVMNGIPFINIISLSTGITYTLRYPSGTDSARMLLLPKIGM